jgi:hypothetical protein
MTKEQFEVTMHFHTCSHTAHFAETLQNVILIAVENGCAFVSFEYSLGNDWEAEPHCKVAFLASQHSVSEKTISEWWEFVPEIFTAASGCRCPVCEKVREQAAAKVGPVPVH